MAALSEYHQRFCRAADDYDGSGRAARSLEQLMADYSEFVLDHRTTAAWAALGASRSSADSGPRESKLDDLIDGLRDQSARCAAISEKYRAVDILNGGDHADGYFANVEACIESEFGALAPTAGDTVVLIGSGAVPMTLLAVAERTGASVAGVDIDPEAIELSRRVVRQVAPGLQVELHPARTHQTELARQASHIVISSTIRAKFDILDDLHAVVDQDCVIAMRFGNDAKSLFNYPLLETDPTRWRLLRTIRRPEHIFDVALYSKSTEAT